MSDSFLPETFLQRLQTILPAHAWPSVVNTFTLPRDLCIRVNTLLTNIQSVCNDFKHLSIPFQQVEWSPTALVIPYEFRSQVLTMDLYQQGKIYSQNLSSQLVSMVLDPQPDEEILDMCAAPGSKTTHIACLMRNAGRIAAVEKIKSRFYKLKTNVQLQQAGIVHCYLKDSVTLWQKTPERFDRVLLDAPCSSEGRFHISKPKSIAQWSPRKIKEMASKQKKLLRSAVHCLKPGGVLVYSTCSFAPEENETVINDLLKKSGNRVCVEPINMEVVNLSGGLTRWQNAEFSPSLRHAVRVLPTQAMDGFFICKLRKHEYCQ